MTIFSIFCSLTRSLFFSSTSFCNSSSVLAFSIILFKNTSSLSLSDVIKDFILSFMTLYISKYLIVLASVSIPFLTELPIHLYLR